MILKIEVHNEERSFYMYDNVEKISLSRPLTLTKECHPGDNHNDDAYLLSKKPECSCDGTSNGCSDCLTAYRVITRNKDGEEFSFVFDTIMYIMNDNGKTIDKIVANY
jgi:hypothetical protein